MDPYNPPSRSEQFYLAQYIFFLISKTNQKRRGEEEKKETKHNDVTKYNIYSYNVKKKTSCAEGVSGLGSCNVVAS